MQRLIGGVFGIGAGGVLIFNGFKNMKRKNLIENVPTSKIRSIAMGLVEVKGVTEASEKGLLISPLGRKKCLYFNLQIDELRRRTYKDSKGRTRTSQEWRVLNKREGHNYFYLNDETGRVLINTKGADVRIKTNYGFNYVPKFRTGEIDFINAFGVNGRFAYNTELPEHFIKFMEENNIKYKNITGIHKILRFTERTIQPDQQLFIMGTAMDNPFVDEAVTIEGHKDVMIGQGKNEKFYLISDAKEQHLIPMLNIITWAGLIIGAGLILFGFLLILSYLELF